MWSLEGLVCESRICRACDVTHVSSALVLGTKQPNLHTTGEARCIAAQNSWHYCRGKCVHKGMSLDTSGI